MKTFATLTIAVVAILVTFLFIGQKDPESTSTAQPPGVSWVSFDEGVTLAKQKNKKVLVDVYTDWCTWCKKMDSDVYANAEVAKLIDANYVPVKLNAESSKKLSFDGNSFTETQFARAVGVTGYPTTLFLHSDSKPITLLPGYVPAERFVDVLRYIGDDHFKSISFEDFLAKSKSVR